MKRLRERFHLIVHNLSKLLYFTAVLDISQCSQATPTMLVTDMKTCVRDLMFDPETTEIVLKISAETLLNFSYSSEAFFHGFSDPKTAPKSIKNHAVDPQADLCWSRRLRKGCRSSQTCSKPAVTATLNASGTPQNSSKKTKNR